MFTYAVDEDIEFFRLILAFQFMKELKMNFFSLLKKQKKRIVFYL